MFCFLMPALWRLEMLAEIFVGSESAIRWRQDLPLHPPTYELQLCFEWGEKAHLIKREQKWVGETGEGATRTRMG